MKRGFPPLEEVRCNLCGANQSKVVYPSRRRKDEKIDSKVFLSSSTDILKDPLVKCNYCGLLYVNPRIKASLALRSYSSRKDRVFTTQTKGRERTFRRNIKIIQRYWQKRPGTILDVGTGNGSFLKIAREANWGVFGCEPNRWLVNWCYQRYGIKVNQGTLFDYRPIRFKFDIVTLWDVLEHTADPDLVLRSCYKRLKPDGLILINFPDSGSWIARLMGRYWVFLVSVHYYYFTRKTLKQYLLKYNFEIIKFKPHIQTLELDYILQRSIPYIGNVGKLIQKFCRITHLSQCQLPYWIGQTLVVARKRINE